MIGIRASTMNAWRGTCLILEKSHLYVKGRVLRHPLTQGIVVTQPSQARAERWCRQNGFSWMRPVENVDQERREAKL